jgi:hypothetical protein
VRAPLHIGRDWRLFDDGEGQRSGRSVRQRRDPTLPRPSASARQRIRIGNDPFTCKKRFEELHKKHERAGTDLDSP